MKRILNGMPKDISHPHELEVIQELNQLPEPWALAHNVLLPDRYRNNAPDETDVILIGPPGVFSLELKYWKGQIHGSWQDAYIYRQERSSSVPESWRNPIKIAINKNSILYSILRDRLYKPRGKKIHFPVTGGVIFPPRNISTLNISPLFEMPLLHQGELLAFFNKQVANLETLNTDGSKPYRLKEEEISDIYNFIAGKPANNPKSEITAGPYVLHDLLNETNTYQAYSASNILLPTQLHLVKKLKIDPYLPEKEYQELLEKLLREAWALNELRGHPNVIQIISPFQHAGATYVAYEFIEGPNLWDKIDNKERYNPIETLKSIILPVMRSMNLAHQKNIIHRKLTPDTIIIPADGIVKVADFGWARSSLVSGKMTKVNDRPETPYDAPELFFSDSYDLRVDIYSIGAICYEVVTCQAPPIATRRALNHLPLTFEINKNYVDTINPVNPKIKTIVSTAMEIGPGRRFRTIGEMEKELINALSD